MFRWLMACAVVVCLGACDGKSGSASAKAGQVVVFAAASTTDVMKEAGARFEKGTGAKVVFSFDASSNLAKQIKAGAGADVFVSADEKWMDDVEGAGGIVKGTRRDLLGNGLVVVVPRGKGVAVKFEKGDAGALKGMKKIAVGDPTHVPAGRYAKQALEALGWWGELEGKLVPAQDVRAALRLVEMGEADAGVVYSTDAKVSEKVEVAGVFPEGSHEPVRYPVALCKESKSGRDFVEFLRGAEMRGVFEKAGFEVMK